MIEYLADVLERSTSRQRMEFVVEAMLCTGPERNFPELWKALADLVSDWEPGTPPSPVDSRVTVALSDVDDMTQAQMSRLMMGTRDPIKVGVGREIECARMLLIQLDHAVKEAMRPNFDDSGMSA